MSLKPSIGQIVNPFFLQDSQDANPLNGTPTQVRYFDNAGVDYSDPLFTRDSVTNYTSATRDYDSGFSRNLQFTGTGNNDFNAVDIITPKNYTFTIDSYESNYSGLYFNGTGVNDMIVNYGSGSFNVTTFFTVGIVGLADEVSLGSGGFTGTPINGELFTTVSGATFRFISYDVGGDVIVAYDVSTSPAPVASDVFTGSVSGATVTLANAFVISGNEVGQWSDNFGNQGVRSIQIGSPYTIGVLHTEQVTFPTIGHTVGDYWAFLNARGAVLYDVLSPSGGLTTGEIVTQAGNPGASAVVGFDFGGQLALTYISGQFDLGATSGVLTGGTSGNTVILDNPITSVDTFTRTDGVTTESQIVITTTNQPLDGGNIQIYFNKTDGHNVGDERQITYVPTTINTGFQSNEIQFPNVPFPLQGSAMVSTNGTDKKGVGVFDLSPFGQSSLVAGIVGLYGDGSQSSLTIDKGALDSSIYDTATGKSGDLSINLNSNNLGMSGYDGFNSYGFNVSNTVYEYHLNGFQFRMPTAYNGPNAVWTDDGAGTTTLQPISSLIGPIVNKTTDTDPLFTGTLFSLMHIPSFIYGVYVNGVYQNEGADYTISGVDITFTTTIVSSYVTVVYEYL